MPQDTRSDDLLPVLQDELSNLPKPKFSFDLLLPKPRNLDLSETEVQDLANYRKGLVVLGAAAGHVAVCPGNQEDLTVDQKCPYFAKCPLLRARKAPEGELCPVERTIVEERFSGWCRELEVEPDELDESNRSAISDLVVLDIDEQRSAHILATGEAMRLTQTNVTEAINYVDNTNEQRILNLTWERVLHINAERLAAIPAERINILKNWMLTPEMKWKRAKAEGKAKGTDLGSKQAARADKLRRLDPTIE